MLFPRHTMSDSNETWRSFATSSFVFSYKTSLEYTAAVVCYLQKSFSEITTCSGKIVRLFPTHSLSDSNQTRGSFTTSSYVICYKISLRSMTAILVYLQKSYSEITTCSRKLIKLFAAHIMSDSKEIWGRYTTSSFVNCY